MAVLTADVELRLQRIPRDLGVEFPNVPREEIERDVDQSLSALIEAARFCDFVPLLVHRAVRERLLATT
jgi:Protein of unknown function (DUF3562)